MKVETRKGVEIIRILVPSNPRIDIENCAVAELVRRQIGYKFERQWFDEIIKVFDKKISVEREL